MVAMSVSALNWTVGKSLPLDKDLSQIIVS